MRVDMRTVTSFEPMPVGTYEAVLTGVEERVAQSSGDPYLNWEFTIVGPSEYDNRKVWDITSLSEKALWRLRQTLVALGLDPADLSGEIDFEPTELIGSRCLVEVNQEEWEGQMRNRVRKVRISSQTKPIQAAPAAAPAPRRAARRK